MGASRLKPLTVKEVEKLTASKPSTIKHRSLGGVPGFVLVHTPAGYTSYGLIYRVNGERRGTARGHGVTTLGDHCFMMVGSHVAHDCVLGDHVILTNNALIGGHAEIGDYAILGGAAAVQQRTRVGAHAFIGGLVGVTSDVVPYAMVIGHRGGIVGVNVRGLSRRGFDRKTIQKLRAAYAVFFGTAGPRADRIGALERQFGDVPAVMLIVDFLRSAGERQLTLPRKAGMRDDDEA